jgi:hypothetical protein
MKKEEIPQFRPINDFGMVRDLIEGSLENAKILFDNFLKAKERPHILDMKSINRAAKLYGAELELSPHFKKQIQLWKKETDKKKESNLYKNILELEKNQKEYVDVIKEILTFTSGVQRNDPNQISDSRREELREEISRIRKQGFSLPPNITQRKTLLREGIYAYVFSHNKLGDLGRITITPHTNGQSQFNCEIAGDINDPMTQKRRAIFEPLAREIIDKTSGILGEGTGEIKDPIYKPDQQQVPSTVFPCEKCGELTAMCVFDQWATTRGDLENMARMMYLEVEKLNVPTWVFGQENEITVNGEKMGDAIAMKVWPKRESPKNITSKEFNKITDILMNSHC